jgi:hypothetical protein
MVADSPVLTVIEDWSFPTYMRDARPNSDFALPSSILLRNTAGEVIREVNEVNEYSDAYVHYLLSTYLPLALKRDPTFGLNLRGVAAARWGGPSACAGPPGNKTHWRGSHRPSHRS